MALENLTTIDAMKATAPELVGGLDEGQINQAIEDATLQVLGDDFPVSVHVGDAEIPIQERACRYYALHLLSIASIDDGSGLQSVQVSVLKEQYFDHTTTEWLDLDKWGKAYKDLYDKFSSQSDFDCMIINH